MLYTMLHNRRLYSKVVSTCYITCLYTSNSYMARNITGGYIARWYITCYITFRFYMLFRQLFNMLNRTLWSARAFPASLPWLTPSPLPTVYHFCSAVFIRLQTRHRPPPLPLPHPPPQPPPGRPAPPRCCRRRLWRRPAGLAETGRTRPGACAPRTGRSAGRLACWTHWKPWRSEHPASSSGPSSWSRARRRPRLQCRPQSAWRGMRSWEARCGAW